MNKPYEPPPFTGKCRHCFDRGWVLVPGFSGHSHPEPCGKCPIAGPDATLDQVMDAIADMHAAGVSRPDGETFCGDTPMTPEKT